MRYMTLSQEAGDLPLLVCIKDSFTINGNQIASGVKYTGGKISITVKNHPPYYADLLLGEPCLCPIISERLINAIDNGGYKYGEVLPIFEGDTMVTILLIHFHY
jgi:hypothetical protein